MKRKKLLVLGAGPGGYAAAFMAADKGMDVTLVDSNPKPGGVCLHKGCIPSKTLLHLAKLIHKTREAKAWGLDFGTPGIDLEAMKQWKNECIKCRKEKPSWPWKKIEAFLEGQNGKDIGKDKNPEASGPDGSQDLEADEGYY